MAEVFTSAFVLLVKVVFHFLNCEKLLKSLKKYNIDRIIRGLCMFSNHFTITITDNIFKTSVPQTID